MDEIIRETKIFNEAVKNYEIVQEEDLFRFKEMRETIVQQNSQIKSSQKSIESVFKAHIDGINTQITQLEK